MDIGFDAAGIETLWQCEIDAKPRSVLAKHWPKATRYVDVKDVDGAKVKPVDIITFGSPCQDLSIAGKRAGLAGNRSGLYHQAIRIIKEMRDATQNQYPKVAIWENVRGAFSSNDGDDFHTALKALADIGAVDISWRLVNACNFGVPQRRLRVFVVATFGEERAGQILAKPTRLLWHPPQSGEAGQDTAGEVEEGTGSGGGLGRVAHTLTTQYDASEDGTGRGTPIVATDAQGGHLTYKKLSNCLSTKNQRNDYETETFVVEGYDEYNDKLTGKIHHTLRAGTKQSTGVVSEVDSLTPWPEMGEAMRVYGEDGVAPIVKQHNINILIEDKTPATATAFHMTQSPISGDVSPCLGTTTNGMGVLEHKTKSYKVRRLTPRECERLMGWPDDHTLYDDKGNELSDSARYKMCGNGIASPVAQWIGENIVEAYNA